MEHREYIEFKKMVSRGLLSGAQQHDKAILTLAAGALALSLTFIQQIDPKPHPETMSLLAWSWGLFLVSIASVLFSFHCSVLAFRRADVIADTLQSQSETDPTTLKNHWISATLWFNILSLPAFVAGAILLTVFSYLNV